METSLVPTYVPVKFDGASLNDILTALTAQDNGDLVLTEAGQKELAAKLVDKVDNCRFYIDNLNAQSKTIREVYIKELQRAIKINAKEVKRLKDYIVWAMNINGFKKLPGNMFSLSLARKDRLTMVDEAFTKPTDAIYEQFKEFVTRTVTYKWNVAAITKAIKAKTHNFAFAKLEETFHPNFRAKRKP